MTRSLLAVLILFLAAPTASAIELWAIDAGDLWGQELSYGIDLDPFSATSLGYSLDEFEVVEDAVYDSSTSTLYVSGWGPDNADFWEENTIAVYTGSPGSVSLVSLSNQGMGNHNWLGGIEYLNGSLYAIGFLGFYGEVYLIRIDNPGTSSQTVTQIGDTFGDESEFGQPFALCSDGKGNLLGFTSDKYQDEYLYSFNPVTGEATLLREYTGGLAEFGQIEGLDRMGGKFYAMSVEGTVYELDGTTYDLTEIGTLPEGCWTALVAVPEPGTVVLMLGGLASLAVRRKRK